MHCCSCTVFGIGCEAFVPSRDFRECRTTSFLFHHHPVPSPGPSPFLPFSVRRPVRSRPNDSCYDYAPVPSSLLPRSHPRRRCRSNHRLVSPGSPMDPAVTTAQHDAARYIFDQAQYALATTTTHHDEWSSSPAQPPPSPPKHYSDASPSTSSRLTRNRAAALAKQTDHPSEHQVSSRR